MVEDFVFWTYALSAGVVWVRLEGIVQRLWGFRWGSLGYTDLTARVPVHVED